MSTVSRSWTVALVVGLAVSAGPCTRNVAAAPFRGVGHAPLDEAADPRPIAIGRAREAALRAAIESIAVEVDETTRAHVHDQLAAWTGAYRVLSQRDDGATVTIELEVEIDTQRLRKHISPSAADKGQGRGFVLGKIDVRGCGRKEVRKGELAAQLGAEGVLSAGGSNVTLRVTCSSLGAIRHTHLQGARVRILARSRGRTIATASADGFDADGARARAAALHDALARVAGELATRRRGEVDVIVRRPHPAARVRRLQRSLRRSVVGVREVALAGVEPDGSVRLRVLGSLDARGLAAALEGLSPPGFSLTITEVEDDHAIAIELE